MSTFFVTSRPGFFGSRSMRRLLGPEVRTIEASPTRVVEVPVALGAENVHSGSAYIRADRRHQDESLDAVAGSEFVDDRIRLRE